jgi:glycosyltransferase involved in cell wall biosynthesis/ubiquinone/menaquinone biosynthesis C-methylase UbiE
LKSMKIIQVAGGEARIPVDKGGGIETFIFNLSRELARMGHDVTILDRKYSRHDPTITYVAGVRIVRLYAPRFDFIIVKSPAAIYSFLSLVSQVLNQLAFVIRVNGYLKKAGDIDAVHAHISAGALALVMLDRRWRSKLVFTSHSNRLTMEPLPFRDRATLLPIYWLAKRVKAVTVPAEIMRKKLIKRTGLSPGKVTVIPYGQDIVSFSPDLETGDVRTRYGLGGKKVILCVGRISRDKGTEYLVKAADIVVHRYGRRDAMFLLVGPAGGFNQPGTSDYAARIGGLISEPGLKESVRMAGTVPVENLRQLYAACDMFVLPSLAEGLPTAVTEAMACGKPVIATGVGGVPDQVEDGRSGFIVAPGNERELAEKIMYLLDNPAEAKQMGARGREIARDKFATSIIAERFLVVYGNQAKKQDKQAEIRLSEREVLEDTWEDTAAQRQDRIKTVDLLRSILSEGQLVLDAGCGPGTYGLILAEQGCRVVGVDISHKTLELARRRAAARELSFLPVTGDLEMLPFQAESFDVCFCAYTLHHFPDNNAAVAELTRVLKPGGKMVLIEPNGSNLAVRLSNRLENWFKFWLVKLGADTPNETLHTHEIYTGVMARQGIGGLEVSSHYFGGLPPLPRKTSNLTAALSLRVVRALARVRQFVFTAARVVLPRPLNGTELVITGTKVEKERDARVWSA